MNTLPNVWNSAQDVLIAATMKLIGKQKFAMHTVLPATPAEWQEKRRELLSRLGKAICLEVNHALPLDLEVTGIIQKNGYRVEKLCFQAADQHTDDRRNWVLHCNHIVLHSFCQTVIITDPGAGGSAPACSFLSENRVFGIYFYIYL